MSSVYPYQIWLLFTILIEGSVQTLGETYNEVLIECLNNARNIHLCHGYNGIDQTDSGFVLKNCDSLASKNCVILLRAKVIPRYEDWWDPQILLTVAFNFRGQSIDKESHIEFGFQSNLTDVASVGIHGVKSQSGQLEVYLVQYNALDANISQTFSQINGQNGIELYAGNTTIVLSYTLPSKRISADGLNTYAYHLFDHAYIMAAHDEKPLKRWLLPEAQTHEILHHPGYAYVDCGEITTRCFALTKNCEHECMITSSCSLLVKIGIHPDNAISLYTRRRLGQKSAYVSAGISSDGSMSNDLVFDCMKNLRGQSVADYSYNIGYMNTNAELETTFLSSHRVNELNFLECLWTIPYYGIHRTQGLTVDFSRNAYHILVAMGDIAKSSKGQLAGYSLKLKHRLKGATGARLNIKPSGIIDSVGKFDIPVECKLSPLTPLPTTTRSVIGSTERGTTVSKLAIPVRHTIWTVNGSIFGPTTNIGLKKNNFINISMLIGTVVVFGILCPSICIALKGFERKKKVKHTKTRGAREHYEPVYSKAAQDERTTSAHGGSKVGSKSSVVTTKATSVLSETGVSRNMRSFSSPSGPSHISLSSEVVKDPNIKLQSHQ